MTSQNKRFIPNYQKNHKQLYQILRSLRPDYRNNPNILKSEYDGLRKKLTLREKIIYDNKYQNCNNCKKSHLNYFCNHTNCEICGIRGHQKQICDTPIYYINLLYLCNCDGRKCKNIRSRLNKEKNPAARNSTHCCKCNYPTRLEEMMMYDNRMICQQCDNNTQNTQKRVMTPPLSPRPNKSSKTIEETIEELPPPEDPIEKMELDGNESTTPTYAQIVNQYTSKVQTPIKTQKKHLECLNCGRNTQDNHKKSQMTKITIDEFTLLCEKCTILKENQERFGSSRSIKQCKVCKTYTDFYESRAGGDIVCGRLCNITLTVVNKLYSDKRYNDKLGEEKVQEILDEKCYHTVRKNFEDLEEEFYELDSDGSNDQTTSNNTSNMYQIQVKQHVMKYLNNEFKDSKWLNPTELQEMFEILEDKLPENIPTEIVEQICKETQGDNVKLFFDNNIRENPDSKIQWHENHNPLLPIKPETWPEEMELNDNEIDPTGLAIISIIPNNKDTKKNESVNIKLTNSKNNPIKIISTESDTIRKLEQMNEEGYQINQDLEKRNKELLDTIAQQNMQKEKLGDEIELLKQQVTYNWNLYQNEWVICEKLTQDVKILTERIDNLLSKHSNDTLSRRFIMKTQLQIIRRKDNELKEFATKINQLQKLNNELQADNDEYKSLTEQWQNSDLTQVFSPDTITIFENIIAQCETNLVSTNNDTNPEMEISDKDIEIISQYLNIESM
jgi:hypothetical protein